MKECEVTHTELLYLIESFSAGDLFHRIDSGKSITLGYYRENLLGNKKVQKVWEKIIKRRFLSDSPFSKAVDNFIAQKNLNEHNAAPNKSMDVRAKQRLS